MAALTAARPTGRRLDQVGRYDMGTGTIYAGSLVSLNSSGYAVASSDTASEQFIGIAMETVTATANASHKIDVWRGAFECNSVETESVATLGAMRYVSDDNTVGAVGTTTNDIPVGEVIEIISTSRVWIRPYRKVS